MHRTRFAQVLIDIPAADWDGAIEFWSKALGRTPLQPPRDSPRYVRLPGLDAAPDVLLQRMDEGPAEYHVDIETDDVEAEVSRLEALGARVKRRIKDWVVMTAPTGHVFCVIPDETGRLAAHATTWPTDPM